jgi:hypothetical protein
VGGAAHLVLDREQVPAVGRIDDIAKAVLILVVLAEDQAAPCVTSRLIRFFSYMACRANNRSATGFSMF